MEPLNISHHNSVDDLLRRFQPETCELAWASLFAWRHGRRMCVVQAGDALVFVVPYGDDLSLFGPPLGEISLPQAIDSVEKATGKRIAACERMPESTLVNEGLISPSPLPLSPQGRGKDEIPTMLGWSLFEDRNNFDYVYRREDLATLEGRKYHKKRNLIAQCLQQYDCTYESYSPALVDSLREMQSRWCKAHKCGKTPGLCQEYLAINELFKHGNDFEIFGGAVKIDGVVQAYSLGSRLNSNTAAIHFEKAMPEFKGLYQLINQWVCKHEFNEFEFINREQDVGVEGLRRAKESYFPDRMISKFIVLNGISRDEYEQNKVREMRCGD